MNVSKTCSGYPVSSEARSCRRESVVAFFLTTDFRPQLLFSVDGE
jgi:hypothetical protein